MYNMHALASVATTLGIMRVQCWRQWNPASVGHRPVGWSLGSWSPARLRPHTARLIDTDRQLITVHSVGDQEVGFKLKSVYQGGSQVLSSRLNRLRPVQRRHDPDFGPDPDPHHHPTHHIFSDLMATWCYFSSYPPLPSARSAIPTLWHKCRFLFLKGGLRLRVSWR